QNKKLFDFGFADPDKVELHDGSKSYFLTRSGTDWWSSGTKMESSTVSPLVDKIRDLAASKFAETGFSAPLLDLAVTSNGSKRVERVMVSKNGDKYLAKRENEPALYELNASDVTDLQNLTTDLKPAAVPAPPSTKK